jgi:N-acetylglucosamine-6-phosphate deacetylase
MLITARDFRTSAWIEIEIRGGIIVSVRPGDGSPKSSAQDNWVGPAFWDIQINGRWGHSFTSPELTVEQVVSIVRAQASLGTAYLCPTLITSPAGHMLHGARTIAAACGSDPTTAQMVLGIHLEGPFLSHREGYRGAHPADAVRDPDIGLFGELQEASGGRIILMTLAPERPGAMELIASARRSGVVVALGHTAADGPTIRKAVETGAKLSTHLGNGIAAELQRHPNPIWHQAANDSLFASLIADGHHLDCATLRVLARAKGPERVILVSDSSPLAGLPVGTYGPWDVDPSGRVLLAGTPYLAGSNRSLAHGLCNLMAAVSWPVDQVLGTVTRNPALLIGRSPPKLEPGQPASLVVFRQGAPNEFILTRTLVGGAWYEAAT